MDNSKMKSWNPKLIAVIIIVVALILVLVNNNPPSDLPQTSSPDPLPEKDEIQRIMDTMDIDEKLGQMVMGGYDDINEILPIICDNKLGGVLLFKKNIKNVTQTKQDIQSLKESNLQNKIPIFISVDQEGGKVNRLPSEMGTFESALSIGDRDDISYATNAGIKIAKAMKQLGFNLNFAPVLDIYSNSKNTVIADRAFGTTPGRVSKIGISMLKGLRSENIISTAKHFPGHGDTIIDSHIGLPIVNKSIEELNDFEFKPFVEAIENDVDMIMIAHVSLSKIDDLPSSMSYKIVTDILRKQLTFNGVIITDDMAMSAITQNNTISDAALKAVNAGCDIVLVSQGAQNSVLALNSLKSAFLKGQLSEKRIDESVYRILSLKNNYGLT